MRRPRRPGSLALRLALAAGLWVAVGLGAASWFITGVAIRQVETAFDARLLGLLDATVAAVTIDPGGQPSVVRAPAGADFDRPFGGAYWQVTGPDGAIATSRSLWDQTLPSAPPTGRAGVLLSDAPGPRGQKLRLAQRDVLLPGAPAPSRVVVALSRAGVEAEAARLRAVLLAAFGLLGFGLVSGVVATVILGLAPLRRLRRALAEVRAGTRQRLDLAAPSEIAPVIAEIEALVAANRATVERARTHVGNLAHALRTPLAVLRNALAAPRPDLAAARAEAASLERLVQHHLARARTAARTGLAAPAVAPFAVAEQIAAALGRLFAERAITVGVAGDRVAAVAVDVQDLTEMLGNLMENACKWARTRVVVRVAAADDDVSVAVSDDGPGLPEGDRAIALARGERLDERAPGSGLGLAITADLAALYGGRLELGRSEAGGLCATLRLSRRGGAG